MNEIAIITGVAGGYDTPVDQPWVDNADFIFFTDGESVPDLGSSWNVQPLDAPSHLDPRRKAKFPKINPQRYNILKNYKYVIWIDGTVEILDPSFHEEMLSHMNDGVVFSPHFENRDNYSEAEIDTHPKYHNEPLAEQALYYHSQGFPEGRQLYECTTLAWDPNHPLAEELSALWLQQNLTWSYQDQVSLPYCVWKIGIEPGLLPQSWREYNWHSMNLHVKDEMYA